MPSGLTRPEAPRKKRLAIFLDGTWNTVADNTNVWRMRALCADMGSDGQPQSIYYDIGLGTTFGQRIRGGMLGYGLSDHIIKAYEWLIENYNLGDEIFIFGFSRGAYTARSLAGFIAKCGLLMPGAPLGVSQLYNRYRTHPDDRTIWRLAEDNRQGKLGEASLEERWMLKYSMRVNIKFVGVWDTVGALGLPAFHISGVSRSTFGFLHTGLRKPIEHGFHALAIDEHRRAFAPTLWTVRRPRDPHATVAAPRQLSSVEQRWFVGAHANVGGGCQSDLLAQLPLKWMMEKALLHGLAFRNGVEIDGDVLESNVSKSYEEFMHGLYSKLVPSYDRPIGAPPEERPDGTHTNVNETIDKSVFDRWRSREDYRPKNLIDWANRHGVPDIAGLHSSVRADNPQISVPD